MMEKQVLTMDERGALEFLKMALPEADRISIRDDVLQRVARHALMVRRETPWGKEIPEDVFRAYVLFPRVNNEDFVFYHEEIWSEICPRLQGMNMEQAVQEINIWAFERATYQSTDDRTANALTVLRRTFGRCGEESTLLVSALRSAGIPARQIYVPRWAHCDDNHAWVEAWVDGEWRYLGACEPEPELDVAWFTSPASKAMLAHTRAYGVAPDGEQVVNRIGSAYVINRTEAYARTCRLTVCVVENGMPKPGAQVRFELANMAELYPINIQTTDEDGIASLVVGLGTLHLHVHDGERYICKNIDVNQAQRVEIDFGCAQAFDRGASQFDQRPPQESRIQATEFSEEQLCIHNERMKQCDARRAAIKAGFAVEDPDLARACGNHAEICAFLKDGRFAEADKRLVLSMLREKDCIDATAEMLADALAGALPFKADYPAGVWTESVLAPRIWNEPLRPVRASLCAALGKLGWPEHSNDLSAMEKGHRLWKMLSDRVEVCEMDPPGLYPDLRAILPAGLASAHALDVLFIAAARSIGLAARLNPANEEKEIWMDGRYRPLLPAKQADAMLVLTEQSGRELQYGVHFSIGVLENGAFRTLHLYGKTLKERLEIPVFAGRYRVLTCMRQIDGAIDGAMFPVEIASGETVELEIALRESRMVSRIEPVALPELTAQGANGTASLPMENQKAIVACIVPGQEPTEHLLNELLEDRDEIARLGFAVRLLIAGEEGADNEKLNIVLRELADVQLLTDVKMSELVEWRRLMRAGELRQMPFVAAVDGDGKGLFATAGYRVGSVKAMIQVLTNVK